MDALHPPPAVDTPRAPGRLPGGATAAALLVVAAVLVLVSLKKLKRFAS